jgi:hypothetical protein
MPKNNYFKIFKTKKYLGFGVGSGFFYTAETQIEALSIF